MNILLIYDIKSSPKALNAVRKACSEYLFPIQHSVFEGEVSKSELRKMTEKVQKIVDMGQDSVIIYFLNEWIVENKRYLAKNEQEIDKFVV